jgi:hydrogenase nickel incorporation protein HypA/HybF
MHELSIAKNLIELACELGEQQGATRITRIQVRLGALSAVMRSLYFCFGPASRGTLCEGAVLEIEEVPLTVHCPQCDEVKTPRARYNFRCPSCGTPTPRIVTGRELQLVAIQFNENAGPSAPPGSNQSERPASRALE